MAASRTSSRNTAFPALTKPGKGLARVKRTSKRTDQVVGGHSSRMSSRNIASPAPTKPGKVLEIRGQSESSSLADPCDKDVSVVEVEEKA